MSKLPTISIKPHSSNVEMSFRQEELEDYVPGPNGNVTLVGGPSFHGHVKAACSKPLRDFSVPLPPGISEKRLQNRVRMGEILKQIAAETPEEPLEEPET